MQTCRERLGGPILTADHRGSVAYRACTSTSKCMCTETPLRCARQRFRMSLAALRLHHGRRSGDAAPELAAWTGATPLFRCPGRAHPRLGGVGCGPAHRGPGLARRCPIARRTGGRRTGAPPPRSGAEPPSRVGIIGRERPRGDGGRGMQTHLRPNPYQALGLGGRSRPGQCWGSLPSRFRRCGPYSAGRCSCPGGRDAILKTLQGGDGVVRQRIGGKLRVNRRRRRSVNRTRASFAHSSAAVSRAPLIGSEPRRGARSARRCRGGSIRGRPVAVPVS